MPWQYLEPPSPLDLEMARLETPDQGLFDLELNERPGIQTDNGGCYGGVCPLKVHVVDGVAVKIEGDPDAPLYNGRICSRGQGAIRSSSGGTPNASAMRLI